MATNTDIFGDIYEYTENGTVSRIPDMTDLREKVANGFRSIFGSTFSTDPSTPNGVLVDAVATVMFDCIGVCAQNVNGLSLSMAIGNQLDVIGRIFGVERTEGEDDVTYRSRIKESMGLGEAKTLSGVMNALGKLTSLKSFCVLENNHGVAAARPAGQDNAISLRPHSLFICVSFIDEPTEDDYIEVASTINRSRAPGCDYSTVDDHGSVKRISLTGPGGTTEEVVFTEAEVFGPVSVSVTMDRITYVGMNMENDVANAVKKAMTANPIANIITPADIISAIAYSGYGTATNVSFSIDDAPVDRIVIFPYQVLVSDDISVTVE